MDPENKRKINPWANKKSFIQENRSEPATIRSTNEFEIVIEIGKEKESENHPTITSLCFPQNEIFAYDKTN